MNSMFHFANYLREFIPGFIDLVQPLKAYRKKGAKWEDYLNDKKAQEAAERLRHAVATEAPLTNPDYEAARDYIRTGRPFMLFVDASDYWVCSCALPSAGGARHPTTDSGLKQEFR